ncbi:hypothetical protein FXE32_17805 [Vibrio cholerae]|nr:hypothetical protein [Vibrio cholerae]TXZ77532.1 hypothetical protein FXE32_17805 [Vibrio cholerae]
MFSDIAVLFSPRLTYPISLRFLYFGWCAFLSFNFLTKKPSKSKVLKLMACNLLLVTVSLPPI